jgi:hypothetical protein
MNDPTVELYNIVSPTCAGDIKWTGSELTEDMKQVWTTGSVEDTISNISAIKATPTGITCNAACRRRKQLVLH